MPQYGLYKPDNSENLSTLFSFQEIPLTSTKLNRWNGNIAAAFDLFHSVCAVVLAKGEPGILTTGDKDALSVHAQETPDLTVKVLPGWASLGTSFAGLAAPLDVPLGELILPPQSMPRTDVVLLNPQGEIIILQGTESAVPQMPVIPSGCISLARLTLRPGMNRIAEEDDGVQGYIIDIRPRFLAGDSHRHALDRLPLENPDGIRITFHTQHFFREGTLEVYLNGVLQECGFDYDELSNNRGYTFFIPPGSRSRIQHRYVIDHNCSA